MNKKQTHKSLHSGNVEFFILLFFLFFFYIYKQMKNPVLTLFQVKEIRKAQKKRKEVDVSDLL